MTIDPSPRLRRRASTVVIAIALAAATMACSNDGKTLDPPPPGATAPLRPTTTAASGTASSAAPTPGLLSLTSTDFEPGAPLADEATCLGEGRSPALTWTGLPPGTVEVAVVVTDSDDDLFTNWVVAGLDPATTIEAGAPPVGAVVARNGDGASGYAAPCPPDGDTHLIEFTLYAMTSPSGLTAEMSADQAREALDASPSTRAVVTATATGA